MVDIEVERFFKQIEWVGTQKCLVREGSARKSTPYILKPFTLLYTIFYRKGTPFVYLLLANGKWYLFRIPNLVRTMHPF